MRVVHRSSILRCGGMILSGLFDAGFETKQMGGRMSVDAPMTIDFNARIATAYVEASNEVEKLYSGQYMQDQQRTK